MNNTYEKLKKLYNPGSILFVVRKSLVMRPEILAKKLGISNELYSCIENRELDVQALPDLVCDRIESIVNTYFTTFKLTRQMAFEMFVLTTGMNKKFIMDKYQISERTLYTYLGGENIMQAAEIDKFLLIN